MKIGLLVIATNKYIQFAQQLYDSAKEFFLPGHELTMFVFTNMPDAPADTVRIEQAHMDWPMPTLMRYEIFSRNAEELSEMDYLYYSDVDMRFVDKVGDEVLGDLVGTVHPGFYNKPRSQFTYERHPASSACMGPNDGFMYYAGGFNGGKREKFLEMCSVLSQRINDDLEKGIIAVWHDESHMNKYFFENPPSVVLNPSYCYPESWDIPFKKKLLALDKNHGAMRT